MGEWVSILLNSDAFSEEERRLLLTLARTNKIEPYCILALKTQFSRYLHPKSVDNTETFDTILHKLANIEDYLAKGVVTTSNPIATVDEPVISKITPVIEIPSMQDDSKPRKSNSKLNKLKKLRGG